MLARSRRLPTRHIWPMTTFLCLDVNALASLCRVAGNRPMRPKGHAPHVAQVAQVADPGHVTKPGSANLVRACAVWAMDARRFLDRILEDRDHWVTWDLRCDSSTSFSFLCFSSGFVADQCQDATATLGKQFCHTNGVKAERRKWPPVRAAFTGVVTARSAMPPRSSTSVGGIAPLIASSGLAFNTGSPERCFAAATCTSLQSTGASPSAFKTSD